MQKTWNFCAAVLLCFYLGIHNGRLCLRQADTAQPLQVFPYSAGIFPHNDQTALERGIPCSSRAELTGLLEDYLS